MKSPLFPLCFVSILICCVNSFAEDAQSNEGVARTKRFVLPTFGMLLKLADINPWSGTELESRFARKWKLTQKSHECYILLARMRIYLFSENKLSFANNNVPPVISYVLNKVRTDLNDTHWNYWLRYEKNWKLDVPETAKLEAELNSKYDTAMIQLKTVLLMMKKKVAELNPVIPESEKPKNIWMKAYINRNLCPECPMHRSNEALRRNMASRIYTKKQETGFKYKINKYYQLGIKMQQNYWKKFDPNTDFHHHKFKDGYPKGTMEKLDHFIQSIKAWRGMSALLVETFDKDYKEYRRKVSKRSKREHA